MQDNRSAVSQAIKELMKGGVYLIRSSSGAVYVGSTTSFVNRFAQHLSDLRKKHHINQKLQQAFDECGEDGLDFEILELISERKQLLKREQFFINRYKHSINSENPLLNHKSVCNTNYSNHGRKRSSKTMKAIELVGQPKADGSFHTPYSAAKEAGVLPSVVYYYLKKQKTLEWDK
jgi:group I intron endonuclease